ncbi:MAG TPA: CHASE3 domain-containing protein [Nitrospira sp.]|nr:CHASE3 domain-containing protein [Nitrospira sp.]
MTSESSLKSPVAPSRRFTLSDITFGFATAILILAAIGGLFVQSLFFRVELTDMVFHTHRVLQQLEELLTDMGQFEAAALSYSLAGREEYLTTYKAKRATIDGDLAALRSIATDSDSERLQLQAVEDAVRDILSSLDELVALPHARPQAEHLQREDMLVFKGKKAMDAFHMAVAHLQEEAKQLLSDRITDLKRTWNHTLGLLLIGIGLSTGIIAWLFGTIRTETRTRLRIQEALERSHDELESRVAERTRQLVVTNERLSSLSRRIIRVQEDERRRIARDLHDEIGQLLSAVKLSLQDVQDRVEGSPVHPLVCDSLDVLGQLLQRVRSLALELRPSLLDELGLHEASKWYVKQFGTRAGLTVTFQAEGAWEDLPEEIEIACFRVLQEALTNIGKHAHATQASVKLIRLNDHLDLTIADNGTGFLFNEARSAALIRGTSLGLVGMEERLRLVGGTLDIVSATGAGTEVRAQFPLRRDGETLVLSGGPA